MTSGEFSKQYERYRAAVERRLGELIKHSTPVSVYEPVRYALSSGGKRIRAILVMLGCEAAGGKASRAVHAAVAVELLHNFTLIHDDIMDHAGLRRGKPTVHAKWDDNVAILSGDQMAALAYRALLRTASPRIGKLCAVFTQAFLEVCEGQGYDKEFECRDSVSREEYMMMIGKKTGKMISAATEIGGLIGGGNARQVAALRNFGGYLGRAFQIQDDLLDITGNKETFGKAIGGDITEGKKTFLLVEALSRATGNERKLLRSIRPNACLTPSSIRQVRDIYERNGVLDAARKEIRRDTLRAERSLASLAPTAAKAMLIELSQQLSDRQS